jgi:hypothetical protein
MTEADSSLTLTALLLACIATAGARAHCLRDRLWHMEGKILHFGVAVLGLVLLQSYPKWVEGGGARVAPVRVDMPDAELDVLLSSLNGFLFTGGGVEFFFPNKTLTRYSSVALKILNTVKAAHAAGQTVPLWGTCLGFQLLNFVVSGPDMDTPVVSCPPFNAEDIQLPLDVTSAWAGSRMQKSAAAAGGVDTILATEPVTPNFHHCGVTPEDFNGNSNLTSTFGLPLSTNKGLDGKEFVSTIEGLTLPLFGTQWHPEKAVYEWTTAHTTDHNDSSVKANSWTARFFIDQARKNDHAFPSASAEAKALIYNYAPEYTGAGGAYDEFEQCYFF